MMTVVKRITANEDFLTMPFKDRNCEVELYEDCRTRKLLDECNCVPWELQGFQVQILDNECSDCFCTSTWIDVIQKEETVLRRTRQRLSTVVFRVLGSTLTFSGLERLLKRRQTMKSRIETKKLTLEQMRKMRY